MTAILCDSAVVVVVVSAMPMHPRVVLLAMITMGKSIYEFPFFNICVTGLHNPSLERKNLQNYIQ